MGIVLRTDCVLHIVRLPDLSSGDLCIDKAEMLVLVAGISLTHKPFLANNSLEEIWVMMNLPGEFYYKVTKSKKRLNKDKGWGRGRASRCVKKLTLTDINQMNKPQ